jgi:hypothetical protein
MQDKTPQAQELATLLQGLTRASVHQLIKKLDTWVMYNSIEHRDSGSDCGLDALEILASWDFYEGQPDTPQKRMERDITRAIAEQMLRNARA